MKAGGLFCWVVGLLGCWVVGLLGMVLEKEGEKEKRKEKMEG